MLQLVKMQVEAVRVSRNTQGVQSIEQIYQRIFRALKPKTPVPEITVRFRKYANANSRVRLFEGKLTVDISDLLERAPAHIQESLAMILLSKLFRKVPDESVVLRYRLYLNRSDVRRTLHLVKRERGRKAILHPRGQVHDLCVIFEELNFQYFNGLMARPELGWSVRPSRTTLGHYDPSHQVIVLSSLLDLPEAPQIAVRYVMYHEMLHLRYPTEHRGIRRCVHTPEFKEAERRFKDFQAAKSALNRFLEEMAGRSALGRT